jgi:predicted nucleotidyltransferase component of viral defense system
VKKDRPRNLPASVRNRLLDRARQAGEDFQLLLTHFVIERLLYRLSQSDWRDDFVLKGAMLFRVWTDKIHRPTRDVDLLGKGDHSVTHVGQVFRAVCALAVEDDGLVFDANSVTAERIKEDQDYEGVRVHCRVRLENAEIVLQIDIGFGDAVTPRTSRIRYPTLLDFPAPDLKAYPRQTVVAEKYQAMVALGIANSRMKDFYDLWVLARTFEFDGPTLSRAIQATFRRRKTDVPATPPLALTEAFATDAQKTRQWAAFLKKGKLEPSGFTLAEVCDFLNQFLMPVSSAIAADTPFEKQWLAAGPWKSQSAAQSPPA